MGLYKMANRKNNLEYYEEWRNRTTFFPLSEITKIWDMFPTCRIPSVSSWYAIANNEQELIGLIKRVEKYMDVFSQTGIIKQVYVREDPDDVDDGFTVHVDELEDTEEQIEFYTVDCNEFFSEDAQLQVTKNTELKDPYADFIVLTDDAKDGLAYPVMLDYYYNTGDDRLGKFTIHLITLKPLHNMAPREGDVKIHFWSFL